MKKLIKFLIFALLIAAFIYLGTKEYNVDKGGKSKSNKPASVLTMDNTLFEEINHSKLLSMLNSKNNTMVLYLCYPDNKLCDSYAKLINEIASNYEIEKIYYYDFKTDKIDNNATYLKIINKLSDYLLTDATGVQTLHAPSLYLIKNGVVVSYDDDLAINRGKKAINKDLDEEKIMERTVTLTSLFEEYINHE